MALWTLLIATLVIVTTSSDAIKVVYTRAYYGKNLGVATKYHAQYRQIARKSGYYTLTHWSSSFPCGNFEANVYGDYMGFFSCNMYFEPYNYDYCCGKKGAHYCCPNATLATPYRTDPDPYVYNLAGWVIAVIVVSVLILVLPVIGVIIYCCVAACCLAKATNRRTNPQAATNSAAVVTVTSGYPQQPAGYPQQPTGYPQQPTGYPQQPAGEACPPQMQQPSGAYAYPMPQMAAYPPTGDNYSKPSDYGYPTTASGDQPPPAYTSAVQST